MGSSKGGGHNSPVHPTGLAKKGEGRRALGLTKVSRKPEGEGSQGR